MALYFIPYATEELKEAHKNHDTKLIFGTSTNCSRKRTTSFEKRAFIADFDAYVFSIWTFLHDIDISEFKNVLEFGKRIEARPQSNRPSKSLVSSPISLSN